MNSPSRVYTATESPGNQIGSLRRPVDRREIPNQPEAIYFWRVKATSELRIPGSGSSCFPIPPDVRSALPASQMIDRTVGPKTTPTTARACSTSAGRKITHETQSRGSVILVGGKLRSSVFAESSLRPSDRLRDGGRVALGAVECCYRRNRVFKKPVTQPQFKRP